MNWRDGELNPKVLQLKLERKMSHLNIAIDRYASIGTIMHYILVINIR